MTELLLADRIVADIRDRAGWAERREYSIGASDAAAFAKPESVESYVRAKLMPAWSGGKSSEWGDEREPVILADHGYTQNTSCFRSIENERFLATPDGIKLGPEPRLCQVKTTVKHFVSKRTGEYMIPPNYIRQVYWEQMVMGPQFTETDFVWEVHANYVPELYSHKVVIPRNEVAIQKLITIANDVLHRLDLSRIDLRGVS